MRRFPFALLLGVVMVLALSAFAHSAPTGAQTDAVKIRVDTVKTTPAVITVNVAETAPAILRTADNPQAAPVIGIGLTFLFIIGHLTYLRSPLKYCDTQRFTNSTGGDLAAGAWVAIEDIYGILLENTANGAEGVVIVGTDSQGYECAKDAVAVAAGEDAYLIVASSLVTNVVGANIRIGRFVESAAGGVARVRTKLQQA